MQEAKGEESLPKIAILADPLDNQRAGVHVFTKELIHAIIALGQGDRLLLIREKVDPQLPVEQIAIPNTRLPIGFASLRLFFLVPFILRRRKDVTIVFEPAHFGPFNLPKRMQRITMIHDLTPLIFPQYHRWHSQILQKIFLPSILKKTNWVLTNSKHTQQDVIRFFSFCANKTSHIYLGKHSSFRPTPNAERIQLLGIDSPYFLFVGTLEPRKNLLLLLQSFETFCIENTEKKVQLVLVGSMGWKSDELQNALGAHPNKDQIKILGFVDFADLPVLYTHAKALIYPSQYEGFGLPIIEAMACGARVITAQNSSLQEIGEGAAIFFPTHDANELYKRMDEVHRSTTEHDILIEHAGKFSWERCAKEFLELCRERVK